MSLLIHAPCVTVQENEPFTVGEIEMDGEGDKGFPTEIFLFSITTFAPQGLFISALIKQSIP